MSRVKWQVTPFPVTFILTRNLFFFFFVLFCINVNYAYLIARITCFVISTWNYASQLQVWYFQFVAWKWKFGLFFKSFFLSLFSFFCFIHFETKHKQGAKLYGRKQSYIRNGTFYVCVCVRVCVWVRVCVRVRVYICLRIFAFVDLVFSFQNLKPCIHNEVKNEAPKIKSTELINIAINIHTNPIKCK